MGYLVSFTVSAQEGERRMLACLAQLLRLIGMLITYVWAQYMARDIPARSSSDHSP